MIAEVASRFTSIQKFKQLLNELGFTMKKESAIKDFFFIFVLEKTSQVGKKKRKEIRKANPDLLKPCLYKKR